MPDDVTSALGHCSTNTVQSDATAYQYDDVQGVGLSAADRYDPEHVVETLTEEIQKRSLTPLEEARKLNQLIEMSDESHGAIATRLGITSAYLSKRLALLRLEGPIKAGLEEGAISVNVAVWLAALKPEQRLRVYPEVRGRSQEEGRLIIQRVREGGNSTTIEPPRTSLIEDATRLAELIEAVRFEALLLLLRIPPSVTSEEAEALNTCIGRISDMAPPVAKLRGRILASGKRST